MFVWACERVSGGVCTPDSVHPAIGFLEYAVGVQG